MSELANYSIETDHTVLLAFSDGRRVRVPIGQLPHHLTPPDLAKVRASLKLRRDFMRTHMPKAVVIVVGAGLLALLAATGGRAVAHLLFPATPAPAAPGHTGIVRSEVIQQGPASSPVAQPAVKGESSVASTVTQNQANTVRRLRKSAARVFTTPLPKITPVPTPPLAPGATPPPSPSVLPTPTPSPSATPDPIDAPVADGTNDPCATNPSGPDCNLPH